MKYSYIKQNLKVSTWNNSSITFLDLTNAGKAGKECDRLTIQTNSNDPQVYCDIVHNMNSATNGQLSLEDIETMEQAFLFADMAEALHNASIFISREKAIRVFPVNDLSRIKPLKAVPNKWTVAHVVKALVNNQYEFLRCEGKYTDDYAYDNAANFQRGELPKDAALAFAKDIYESPRGWWASAKENNIVSICCHTFDLNEFKFKL